MFNGFFDGWFDSWFTKKSSKDLPKYPFQNKNLIYDFSNNLKNALEECIKLNVGVVSKEPEKIFYPKTLNNSGEIICKAPFNKYVRGDKFLFNLSKGDDNGYKINVWAESSEDRYQILAVDAHSRYTYFVFKYESGVWDEKFNIAVDHLKFCAKLEQEKLDKENDKKIYKKEQELKETKKRIEKLFEKD
jgi:ribosomal protein L14E/L6E/L27E